MKEILLVPGPALSSKIEIEVMDFPNGIPSLDSDISKASNIIENLKPSARKRCKITVEYGRPDIIELKNQGLDLDEALDYYKNHIFNLVKFHILSDWTPINGMVEIIALIREKIVQYY